MAAAGSTFSSSATQTAAQGAYGAGATALFFTAPEAQAASPTLSFQTVLTLDQESAPRKIGAGVGGFILGILVVGLIGKRAK